MSGGIKKERITQGSNMRRPKGYTKVKDVEKMGSKPNKDAFFIKALA